MSFAQVTAKLDANRQPHVIQPYVVPPATGDEFARHDHAVHSLWMHFVDLCAASAAAASAPSGGDRQACYAAPDTPLNTYTQQPRLPVFRALSAARGRPLSRAQLLGIEPVATAAAAVVPAAPSLPLPQLQVQQHAVRRVSAVRDTSPVGVMSLLSPHSTAAVVPAALAKKHSGMGYCDGSEQRLHSYQLQQQAILMAQQQQQQLMLRQRLQQQQQQQIVESPSVPLGLLAPSAAIYGL